MQKLCLLIFLCVSSFLWGQNHAENFETISTEEQAEEYASSFKEVFTGTVNMESDVFFFDDIDTSKLNSYVGTSKSFYGKTTKLLEDSIFNIVNVQIIKLDYSQVSEETSEILAGQMKKLLERGDSYWDVKKRFAHTSAMFTSAPEIAEEITKEYGITQDQMTKDEFYQFKNSGSTGFIIIEKDVHKVPGFCTISFINLNNGNFR